MHRHSIRFTVLGERVDGTRTRLGQTDTLTEAQELVSTIRDPEIDGFDIVRVDRMRDPVDWQWQEVVCHYRTRARHVEAAP